MCLISLSFVVLFVLILNNCFGKPLDDYVNTPDPMFSWKRLQTYPQPTYTVFILNMTSQQWFDGKIFLYKMFDYSSLLQIRFLHNQFGGIIQLLQFQEIIVVRKQHSYLSLVEVMPMRKLIFSYTSKTKFQHNHVFQNLLLSSFLDRLLPIQ